MRNYDFDDLLSAVERFRAVATATDPPAEAATLPATADLPPWATTDDVAAKVNELLAALRALKILA